MPIKGLSDRRRLTRGGHIRLGIKKTSAKGAEYPEKSDHFIADFENDAVQRRFYELYGAEPKRITIAFGNDDPEFIFPQYYKAYGKSSGLKCKGDGETASRITDKGELVEVDCPGPEHCDFARANGCKQMASLQFFIKGLPGIQIFQINTTSFNSIVNLNTGIELLQRVRGAKSICGVWVDLLLVPQDAQANGKRVLIYVMKLDIKASLDNLAVLECAFDPIAALPAPDESRDEYLTPTAIPQAEEVDRSALDARFARNCADLQLVPRDEAKKLQAAAGVKSWKAVPDAMLESACESMELRLAGMQEAAIDVEAAGPPPEFGADEPAQQEIPA